MIFQNPFDDFNKQRVFKFDFLKLLAALLVILDHTLSAWVPDIKNSQLYNFIFLTHMALFMFVAGRIAIGKMSKIDDGKSLINNLASTCISLLLPFIVFSFVKSVVLYGFSIDGISFFGSCFEIPQNSVWFLWSLFWIETLYYLAIYLGKIFNKKFKINQYVSMFSISIILYGICGIIAYFSPKIFDFYYIAYYSILFLFGVSISLLLANKNIELKYQLILLFIFAGVLTVVMVLHPTAIFDEANVANFFIKLAGNIGSVLACSILVSIICKFKPIQMISKLGMYSLELYLVHILLMYAFEKAFSPIIVNGEGVLTFIIYYLTVVLATYLVVFVLKAFKPSNWIFFGKFKVQLFKKDK